jgi:hypothetical protein
MKQSETNNTATLLDDGRVLLAGGVASIYCDAGCTHGCAGRGELHTPCIQPDTGRVRSTYPGVYSTIRTRIFYSYVASLI